MLLRHGETPFSGERRFAGVGDIPLTATGQAQAEAAGRRLAERYPVSGPARRHPRLDPIDVIVSSPLRRAYETATTVGAALDLPVTVVDDMRETDFGAWEGLTFAEAKARWSAELDAWLADSDAAPPEGESFATVTGRVERALAEVLRAHRGRTVLVVSHVTPIKVIVRHALLAPPESIYRMHLDVSSLSIVDWYDDGPAVLRAFNDTAHLG